MEQKLCRAKVDADGVYWGVEEVAELGAQDLAVPSDCDLRAGAYKAVRNDAGKVVRFDPLPPHLQKRAVEVVDDSRALYEIARLLHGQGMTLPKALLDWCVAWEGSFDNLAAASLDTADRRGLHDYFRVANGLLKPRPQPQP